MLPLIFLLPFLLPNCLVWFSPFVISVFISCVSLASDLDDTLYPLSSGIARECGQNIKDYMVEKLGIDKSKILELSNSLYKNYGTTMAGLRAIGYDFDYHEYHSYVHGRLPYDNIKPDPVLRTLLLSLPLRKIIFTNADKLHAARALERLGLEDCFEGIVCFESLNSTNRDNIHNNDEIFDIITYLSSGHENSPSGLPKTPIVCKPSETAIVKAIEIANIDPQRTLFFEDSVRNIQAGKRVGLSTVLVGTSQRVKCADYAVENIHNLKEALPELWELEAKPEKVRYSGKLAVETTVIA
ncbi:Haloacid dehalogenase-like hydrolase (HAD) superfamily protein [Raphanus sativus]|nr:Haloacid dehalogenase-like hydrolase (HAD) superfamily protein [Raphanus sativus]